jgi:hypothetical protein
MTHSVAHFLGLFKRGGWDRVLRLWVLFQQRGDPEKSLLPTVAKNLSEVAEIVHRCPTLEMLENPYKMAFLYISGGF